MQACGDESEGEEVLLRPDPQRVDGLCRLLRGERDGPIQVRAVMGKRSFKY